VNPFAQKKTKAAETEHFLSRRINIVTSANNKFGHKKSEEGQCMLSGIIASNFLTSKKCFYVTSFLLRELN
jgi:hypothetical protein